MEKITNSLELKMAIQRLEAEQSAHLDELKGQLHRTYENLKPANLLKNALGRISSPAYFNDKVLNPFVTLASAYIAKKIAVGSSSNPFRKILGSLAQYGVANMVSKHSQDIIAFALSAARKFMGNEERSSEEEEQ